MLYYVSLNVVPLKRGALKKRHFFCAKRGIDFKKIHKKHENSLQNKGFRGNVQKMC